jgi:hypothetical protein
VLTYSESALFWIALDGSVGRVPLLPGDNVTGLRLVAFALRRPSSSSAASTPFFAAIESELGERAVIHCPCPAVISRTQAPLLHASIPLCIPELSIATPIAVIIYITTRSPHQQYTITVRRYTTHSPSTPSRSTHPHQPSISIPPLHQPRVYLMTGASSNKPAV